MTRSRSQARLAQWAFWTLVANILVALNGVFVRATDSGAGCGRSWPFCYDNVLPPTLTWHTVVEYGHRIFSATAFLLVVYVFVQARRIYSPGHRVRKAAGVALAFMVAETLAGASLVIFDWVVNNLTWGRVVIMGVHLTITHGLIAAVALTAWLARRPEAPLRPLPQPLWRIFLGGLILIWAVAVLGADTALNEVVHHWETLGSMPPEFVGPARFVRAIVWVHIAAGVVLALYLTATLTRPTLPETLRRTWGRGLILLVWLQLALGALNWWVLRMAATIQMVHLLIGYAIWIGWWYLFMEARATQAPAAVPSGWMPQPAES